jgi:hypothetical protein
VAAAADKRGAGFALVDPHGDLVERVASQVPAGRTADVIYLNAADPSQPYGYNPLRHVREDRIMLLDDVTSSFDAGHQFHLMEVIRTKFARPGQPTGPQVILLSHDTLLEKLLNKNANSADWQHVRLEGTARTAVLPQSNAGNRVRDATVRFLNAGQVEDGALRLRQYLEYKLLEVIGRVNISVPVDFALDDTKKQGQAALDAIQSAVALHLAGHSKRPLSLLKSPQG